MECVCVCVFWVEDEVLREALVVDKWSDNLTLIILMSKLPQVGLII